MVSGTILIGMAYIAISSAREVKRSLSYYNPDKPEARLGDFSERTQKLVKILKALSLFYLLTEITTYIFLADAYILGVRKYISENWELEF